MNVSDEGYVTGSVDVSKLDEINPTSDEAKAQLAALKRERDLGQAQAAADAERVAKQHEAQAAQFRPDGGEGGGKPAQAKADESQSEAKPAEDNAALYAEAEQAGVTVDKRWGADRLRQEIDAAKARKR